jgi:hypothetical protein
MKPYPCGGSADAGAPAEKVLRVSSGSISTACCHAFRQPAAMLDLSSPSAVAPALRVDSTRTQKRQHDVNRTSQSQTITLCSGSRFCPVLTNYVRRCPSDRTILKCTVQRNSSNKPKGKHPGDPSPPGCHSQELRRLSNLRPHPTPTRTRAPQIAIRREKR